MDRPLFFTLFMSDIGVMFGIIPFVLAVIMPRIGIMRVIIR